MKTLVLFYSRTGTTRRLAETLVDLFGADRAEIRCDRYGPGPFRYLLAGYDSVKGNLPAVDVPDIRRGDYDLILIGTPVWTSHPALPLRAYLASEPLLPDRVGLFITHGGHSPPGTAISELNALLPAPAVASLAVTAGQLGTDGGLRSIRGFVNDLTEPAK